jgi:uncharacterized protein (DUF952 family)
MSDKLQEKEITDLSLLPRHVFHLVPELLFEKFIDKNGSYDCRYKKEWGGESPFIHTTPTKKQLKERVADINWKNYQLEEKFILLKIDTRKTKSRYTYSNINGNIYHHIWGALTKDSFTNFVAKLGMGTDNLQSSSVHSLAPFVSRLRVNLEAMYRSSWLVGQVVDTVAEDMTREGITINSKMI